MLTSRHDTAVSSVTGRGSQAPSLARMHQQLTNTEETFRGGIDA